MKQNDPDVFIVGEIQDIIDRTLADEWSDFLKASTTAASSTAPPPNEKTLLDMAESMPPGTSINWLGLEVIVSPLVPTTEDRLRLDERSILRRMFTRNLCGVHTETVPCAHIFLVDLDRDGTKKAVITPGAAAVLKLRTAVTL